MMKKWIIGCAIPLVLALGLIGGCMVWFTSVSTYYVETYKPDGIVTGGDEAALRTRLTPFEFDHVTVFLEWYTYDNATINTAPYKLFVVVEPKSPLLRSVDITSVSISSSLGHDYSFAPSMRWPTVLTVTNTEKRVSHTFEPGFMFEFEQKEDVMTHIEIRIRSEGSVQEETIDVKWVPVRVRHAAPIV